jgi:homoprotocatechuate degradation regulator HpaR
MLRDHGLTEQQWRVIRALMEATDFEISELAGRCFILSPSLSRILQTLEGDKLVKRVTDKADQRRARISITAKGRRLFETIAPESERHYTKLTETFGKAKLSQLYTLLDELREVLEREREVDR